MTDTFRTSLQMLAELANNVTPPSGEVIEISNGAVVALEDIFAEPSDGSESEIERQRRWL